MKHSPSREEFWPKMKKANKKIECFMKHQSNAGYIDIVTPMDDKNGNPRPELFLDDMLHMKPEGYKIWQRVMLPYLE